MGNFNFTVRTKRWAKFLVNYINERLHGLDFSMVYVGMIQQNMEEFHGYSMADAGDMKRILKAIPVDMSRADTLDVASVASTLSEQKERAWNANCVQTQSGGCKRKI